MNKSLNKYKRLSNKKKKVRWWKIYTLTNQKNKQLQQSTLYNGLNVYQTITNTKMQCYRNKTNLKQKWNTKQAK
jgi:hypothetical protein